MTVTTHAGRSVPAQRTSPFDGEPMPECTAPDACVACLRQADRPAWSAPHAALVLIASIDTRVAPDRVESEARYHCWECGARWRRLRGGTDVSPRWEWLD